MKGSTAVQVSGYCGERTKAGTCWKPVGHERRHKYTPHGEEPHVTEQTITDEQHEQNMRESSMGTAEMTDAEAKEVIVRSPAQEIVPDAIPVPEGVTTEKTQGQISMFHALSQIDEGVFVAWDFCRRCHATLSKCECKQGPLEPPYVTKWREEYLGKKTKAADKAAKKETPVQIPPEPALTGKVDEAIEAALDAVTGVEPTDVGEPAAPNSEEESNA